MSRQSTTTGDTARSHGMVECDAKIENLRRALFPRATSDLQFINWVLNRPPTERNGAGEKVHASLQKWRNGVDPKGHTGENFRLRLAEKLENNHAKQRQIAEALWRGSYAELYALLPLKIQQQMLPPQIPVRRISEDDDEHPLWFRRWDWNMGLIEFGMSSWRIDQKHYYLSPDSAKIWKSLASSPEYRQYRDCESALQKFVDQSPIWRSFLERPAVGVLILGAGASSKDRLILKNLLRDPRRHVHYGIVDFSPYMLIDTANDIKRWLREDDVRARVDFATHCRDFADLSGIRANAAADERAYAWFIPGGTIGNLREKVVFEALEREVRPGDLMIVGAETFGRELTSPARKQIIEKYEGDAVQDFLKAPLRAIWHELRIDGGLESFIRQIKPKWVEGKRHSDVPKSESVEFSFVTAGKTVVLQFSTRYLEDELKKFITERHGFKFDEAVPSDNPLYKQYVFHRA